MVANLLTDGRPSKFTPRSDCKMLRETAKNPRATSHAPQTAACTDEVKVQDRAIRKSDQVCFV